MQKIEHRIPQSKKNANGFQWYKDNIEYYDRLRYTDEAAIWGDTTHRRYRMKVNYDLMANKINPRDFEYVTNPWRTNVGELPAQLENRDIVSRKINAVLGMEYRRPFEFGVVAVNPDATTKKEQEEFNLLKQYVVQMVMGEADPSQDVPKQVRKYMLREHQDPAEVLGNQILSYLHKSLDLKTKFNKGLKHALVGGWEVYYVGEENGEPMIRTVNPLFFDCDKNNDIDYIEDRQWAVNEFRMSPVDIIKAFGEELTDKEKDSLFDQINSFGSTFLHDELEEDFDWIPVVHVVFKSLRKIGFLTYMEDGEERTDIVDENYKRQESDISLEWKWVPEVHEGYKIGKDLYKRMRPIPGQHRSQENLYCVKLPYYGMIYDRDNSRPVSLVDKIRSIQYLYNILMYRVELLMAQDKGKKVAINIGAIPTKSAGVSLAQWEQYFEANNYFYLNPQEEGNRNGYSGDITTLVKEIDLSTSSDIKKYIDLANYLDQLAGQIIGITPQLEGQIQEREAVANVSKVLSLSTNILEPLFQKHDTVKKNALTALLEQARMSYAKGQPRKLSYIMDDMSLSFLTIDQEMLDLVQYGIFITDNSQLAENKQVLQQLAHAAMQNQMVSLSTVLKVMNNASLTEAEEILLAGEEEMKDTRAQDMQLQMQLEQQKFEQQMQLKQTEFEQEMQLIQLKEELRYRTEIDKASLVAVGFAEDKDMNDNRVPDTIDYAKILLQKRKLELEERKVKVAETKAQNAPVTK